MRFTSSHLLFFANLSHDRNPLHTDPGYAARTPLGRVVVYGVWSILWGLGLWANGRGFLLQGLRAQFRKPLYVDEDYVIEVQESGQEVAVQFKRGSVPYVDMLFSWRPYQAPAVQPDAITDFQPLSAALDPDIAEFGVVGTAFDYQLDRGSDECQLQHEARSLRGAGAGQLLSKLSSVDPSTNLHELDL